MSQFRLFPPLTPTSSSKENLPSRGGRGRKVLVDNTSSSTPTLLEDLKGSRKTDAVLRQIRENAKVIQPPKPPPKTHVTKPAAKFSDRLHGVGRGDGDEKRQERKPERVALSSSSTLVENRSPGRFSALSIPIRSVFPRYNPNLPLNQQDYYPQLSSSNSRSHQKQKGLVLSPEPDIDRTLGPKTVPASVMDFPPGVLDSTEELYSSTADLQGLWEAANGQRPDYPTTNFNLRLTRTDPTTFTFSSSQHQHSFYTLRLTTPTELTISRTNPSKPTNSIPIMTLTLENCTRREPPNDGLVSVISSRIAAMLAIEQVDELVKQQHLTPSEALEAERKALKRAEEQESCRLVWNQDLRLFTLEHPSFSKQSTPALVGAAGIPLSPARSKGSGAVHITVSAPSPNDNNFQPPTILATIPTPSNSTSTDSSHLAPTPRTSTLPLTDTDGPLASLDLSTKTLHISSGAVIATIPSLYAIDSVVAGVLAVAVADEGSRGVLMGMEMGMGTGRFQNQSTRQELVSSVAERDDAVMGCALVEGVKSGPNTSTVDNDKQKPSDDTPKPFFWNWLRKPHPRGPKQKKQKNKQIVIEEFDLEKYGRYGPSSSREGEKLPSIARGVLRVLFWGLDLVVKLLTATVKMLAWVLVNLTRCVTSERF